VLDEPTTGLHFADIHKLLDVLSRLVAMGNTVLVIEHNLDVIKTADYVIDLGPEGGDKGGQIVATGTPEEIAKNPRSHTGEYLRGVLTDERAKGRIRVSPERIAKLESANFETLDELTKNGSRERVPIEA
jgi:excinuclease ABC subunit A